MEAVVVVFTDDLYCWEVTCVTSEVNILSGVELKFAFHLFFNQPSGT